MSVVMNVLYYCLESVMEEDTYDKRDKFRHTFLDTFLGFLRHFG